MNNSEDTEMVLHLNGATQQELRASIEAIPTEVFRAEYMGGRDADPVVYDEAREQVLAPENQSTGVLILRPNEYLQVVYALQDAHLSRRLRDLIPESLEDDTHVWESGDSFYSFFRHNWISLYAHLL